MAKNSLRQKKEEREDNLNMESVDNALLEECDIFLQPSSTKAKKSVKKENRERVAITTIKNFFNGYLVLEKGVPLYWRQIVFCFLLSLLLIANNYLTENMIGQIVALEREMKGFKYEQLSTEGDRIDIGKQSSVANVLEKRGIEESLVPPTKIIIN